MSNTIIVDLDNCITDDRWRVNRIRWDQTDPTERFRDYHLLAGFDEPRNLHLVNRVNLEIVIFTARPSVYEVITREWLRRNNINWSLLLMRETGEHGPSVELKESQLKHLLVAKDGIQRNILMAYDDRKDVVEMYRRNGVPATQVAVNDYSINLESKERTCSQIRPIAISRV